MRDRSREAGGVGGKKHRVGRIKTWRDRLPRGEGDGRRQAESAAASVVRQPVVDVGAEPGDYEVRLLDANLQSRATSKGTAAIVDYVTTLATTLDTSALLPVGIS